MTNYIVPGLSLILLTQSGDQMLVHNSWVAVFVTLLVLQGL